MEGTIRDAKIRESKRLEQSQRAKNPKLWWRLPALQGVKWGLHSLGAAAPTLCSPPPTHTHSCSLPCPPIIPCLYSPVDPI